MTDLYRIRRRDRWAWRQRLMLPFWTAVFVVWVIAASTLWTVTLDHWLPAYLGLAALGIGAVARWWIIGTADQVELVMSIATLTAMRQRVHTGSGDPATQRELLAEIDAVLAHYRTRLARYEPTPMRGERPVTR